MKSRVMGKIRRMALVIGISMMSILPAGSAFAAGTGNCTGSHSGQGYGKTQRIHSFRE